MSAFNDSITLSLFVCKISWVLYRVARIGTKVPNLVLFIRKIQVWLFWCYFYVKILINCVYKFVILQVDSNKFGALVSFQTANVQCIVEGCFNTQTCLLSVLFM